ncbi:MAG TPA: condensation domain-containing protein [Solirubrobacteraceae bacterium]|nr:condensation domain-containing protein [Solirubrobacteraceae bacterium]
MSPRRVPFNVVDQSIFLLDQEPETWSVHCEVRVPGPLDSERVAAAARAAAARHPMARARIASFRPWDRRLFWEIPDQVDHLPLEIVDASDEGALDGARARLLSRRLNLDSSPPFALTLAHRRGGDSLIMNLHHAAADGISAYRLMTSIARAYAGVEDPVPDLDPLAVRSLRRGVGAHSPGLAMIRARQLKDQLAEIRSEGPAARVVSEGGVDGATGYGFHLLRLGPEETEAVMMRRRRPATVNDLLVAGLALAVRRFNGERGRGPGRISAMMPVNLRPDDWSEEVVANILSFVSVSVLAGEQSDLATAQLAVAGRTRALKDTRLSGTIIDLLRLFDVLPVGAQRFLARIPRRLAAPALDTAILSNLGRRAMPLHFGDGAGPVTELWFSPPGQMPVCTAIGAATMNDEMFLTLRYCRRHFDAAGAAAFAAAWREALLGA